MTEGILAAIGRTPLVALRRLVPDAPFRIFAKLEACNPGGSIKDRAALGLLEGARRAGRIRPGTVVVESSSGNMGIGLAQACAVLGLRFVCVVDVRTTAQNIAILRAYGAEIDVVDAADPNGGGFLRARIARVRALVERLPDAFWPDQYGNPDNARAHRRTMHEIATALDGRIDVLFCPTSTCGTIRGCAEYVRARGLATTIVAVDAVGSVIFGPAGADPGAAAPVRLIPGHGAAVRPALFRDDVAAACVHVSDLECVAGCRRLVAREGILAGGSSGAAVTAIERLRDRIADGATVVAILPDRGERYLDTIYCDAWVRRHFGALPACDAEERESSGAARRTPPRARRRPLALRPPERTAAGARAVRGKA
ncbi:MAG: 2,3-diaminopropionate biosynthesis protein SbnA [Deltaproteobacteria bacterium]|nr:2,3-diaminopropionate biosynthesis protein SbnA [Deltaproteobacteria bacterium]